MVTIIQLCSTGEESGEECGEESGEEDNNNNKAKTSQHQKMDPPEVVLRKNPPRSVNLKLINRMSWM